MMPSKGMGVVAKEKLQRGKSVKKPAPATSATALRCGGPAKGKK